ncbi:MAG TPA: pilin [Candidatus Competibacter sp.]|nr:pilin [Candidatus Competibacter sp.]
MKHYRRFALTGLVVCIALFGACSKNEQANTPAPAPAPAGTASVPTGMLPPHAAQPIVQPAWLRERLPEHTVAYLRIPSAWGLLSAPNGRPLDPALASEPHAHIVAALREAVRKDKTIADTGLAPALTLLLGDLDAPLEIAVIDNNDALNPASSAVLLSTRLNIANVGELNTRLAGLGDSARLLKAPLDSEGKGSLVNGGFVRFDAASRRLYGLIGMTATPILLDQLIKQLEQTRPHRLHDIERQIDNSGQGLFGWLSLKGVTGMASGQLPDEPGAALVRDLLDKSQSLAFGWGTVDGRGRLQIRLEAPQAKMLGYLAARQYRTDIKTAGKPRWVVSLMLPDGERLTAFENNLAADFGQDIAKEYRDAVAMLGQQYGIVPAELLKLIGPELIGFEDAHGRYTALRVNGRQAFYGKLDELGQRFHWRRETLKVDGTEVQHLMIPSGSGMDRDDGPSDDADKNAALLALVARTNTHLYWIENGSWLLFGEVPQSLADRAASVLDTDMGNWLRQSQGYTPEHTLLGVSAVTRNAQREIYYAYLNGLQMLGDLLGASISLANMPSAGTLKLPVEGAIGLALDIAPDRVGFNISYEQTPAEILLAGDGSALTSVMITGIVAAIAIPAYQDYTVRAQIASVLAETGPLKQDMAEFYAKHKKLPKSDEELDLNFAGDSAKYLEGYGIDGGAIVLYFGDKADAAIKEHTLLLTPYLGVNGILTWVCGYANVPAGTKPLVENMEYTNDIPEKYLPSYCR